MTDPTRDHVARDDRSTISILGEPTRRALYDYIAEVGDWVGRDQAADAMGLERGTAAHHLEKLTDGGLLEIGFQRLTGRQGPGAGRPAKLYRRAHHDIEINLPPRDYRLAGELLAAAVDRSRIDHVDIAIALDEAADAAGRRSVARAVARSAEPDPSDESGASTLGAARHLVIDVLQAEGYEPQTQPDDSIVLRNCPFHQLAQEHTELICGMNLGLVTAAVDSIDGAQLETRLVPHETLCCVRLQPSDRLE